MTIRTERRKTTVRRRRVHVCRIKSILDGDQYLGHATRDLYVLIVASDGLIDKFVLQQKPVARTWIVVLRHPHPGRFAVHARLNAAELDLSASTRFQLAVDASEQAPRVEFVVQRSTVAVLDFGDAAVSICGG